MKIPPLALLLALLATLPLLVWGCSRGKPETGAEGAADSTAPAAFRYQTEQFADLRILRYQVPEFEQLAPRQQELAYYLQQAALSGRDIIYDQNYRHNLAIRRTVENIVASYQGDRSVEEFGKFMVYVKRVWFSNGIHHHYSTWKFVPEITPEYFRELAAASDQAGFPLGEGETVAQLVERLVPVIFDPQFDAKRVSLDPSADLIRSSANNFYRDLTQPEVEAFYNKLVDKRDPRPVSYGLNSRLVKADGAVREKVWKVGGLYGPAIERVVFWLEKALPVAENQTQRAALEKLIEYYRSGELRTFDEYCIKWVEDDSSRVDLINGFIETYGDPMGYRATYESMVYFEDLAATGRIKTIAGAAQWFEQHSPIMEEHQREQVRGVSARVITEVVGAGAVSPSGPIGINLPNSDWIRAEHGSKSVTIGNIMDSHSEASKETGEVEEFILRPEDQELHRRLFTLAHALEVDLHEVVGHGSGRLEPGVAAPNETLKNYDSTLEEARADLVALYFLPDTQLVELGLAPSTEVGRAAYNAFINNGLMQQLRRIQPGEDIEEAHMRNRQLVANWVFEKAAPGKAIERVVQEGKTYFVINDYQRVRELFGELLREIQRIKSQGDYQAGRELVEGYGVKVDQALHAKVLERYRRLGLAAYSGFINPRLEPVEQDGKIVDVTISYPEDFTEQMLYYARHYSFLPTVND